MREARYSEDAKLDEVVASDVSSFHLEQLSDGVFWIGLEHHDGSSTHIKVYSRSGRAALEASCDFSA